MKKIILILSILLTNFFVLNSCKDDNLVPKFVYVDEGLDGLVDYAIFGTDGSSFLYKFKDEHSYIPKWLVIGQGEDVDLIIDFDEKGLPKSIVSENFTIVLGKYEGKKFNAVVITKEGESQIFEGIETDMSWDEYISNIGIYTRALSRDPWKWVNSVVNVVGCGLSIAGTMGASVTGVGAVVGAGLTVISCGGAVTSVWEAVGLYEASTAENVVGTGASLISILHCLKMDKIRSAACIASTLGVTLGIAEMIRDRNKANVALGQGVLSTGNGNVKITLTWDNYGDIDLHCIDPSGFHIYYSNKRSPTGGFLDYDNTNAYGPENIYFDPAPIGNYRVYLHYYSAHSGVSSVNYRVVIFKNNTGQTYTGRISGEGSTVEIATFTITDTRSNTEPQMSETVIDWNSLSKK